MPNPLNVLIVDDSQDDADLIVLELKRGGYDPTTRRVDTPVGLSLAIEERSWDIILSDYTMPAFRGTDALAMVRSKGLDLPFIFVSGTIGEDVAVAAMRAGAEDYIVKGSSARLVPAIERELREHQVRKERNTAQLALQRAQRMESVGQLVGGLAHDFNNLLTIIIGNLDLLREVTASNEEALELASEAVDACIRGGQLTKQLLAVARRQPLDSRVFNVNELIERTIELLSRTLGENIEICTSLTPDLWFVSTDPTQVESALMNLAINARDAMPDGGIIEIGTSNKQVSQQDSDVSPGEYISLVVSDTGSGISEDNLGRIFEPLFTTKGPGRGTGLGLSMVYGFARQAGGSIKVESVVGTGTTMMMLLPRAPPHALVANAELPVAPPSAHVLKARILVVEDNDSLRIAVERQLRFLGHEVVSVRSGQSAILMLNEDPGINLIFTDIVLPGRMSGIDLVAQVQESRPSMHVLFTSGWVDASPRAQEVIADRRHFLAKPYRFDELSRKIQEVLM